MEKQPKTKKVEVEHIRCVWGLICTLSAIDIDKNNISLFNIIEQFNLSSKIFTKQPEKDKPQVIQIPHEVILWWRRTLSTEFSDEEVLIDFKIKTLDPSGQIIQEIISPLKFPKGMKSLRFRIFMPVLFFTIPGDYIYQIEVRSQNGNEFSKKLEIPFEVRSV